jgi:hypothetical protein
LFSAAFSFAYFGLCRISEIAVSNAEAKHIISVNDITFAQNFIKVRIPSPILKECELKALQSISALAFQ